MHVLLDLWGVLLDSDRMQLAYGQQLARYMKGRFGGDEGRWIAAHNVGWTEYVEAVESPDWDRTHWAATVDRLDARFVEGILDRMQVSWRPPNAVAFSRELELEVMSTIDARFPDARAAVDRLRGAGHKVYVATQATDSNARGSLAGAHLLESLDGVFTGTTEDAPKARREYWDRVLTRLAADSGTCVLVDDRVDYLEAATSTGIRGLLLDREGIYEAETMPRFVHATLRGLAGLPHFVEVLEGAAEHAST